MVYRFVSVPYAAGKLGISEGDFHILARRLGWLPTYDFDDTEHYAREILDAMQEHIERHQQAEARRVTR